MGIPIGVSSYPGCLPGNAGVSPASNAGSLPAFLGRIAAGISVDISDRIRQPSRSPHLAKNPTSRIAC